MASRKQGKRSGPIYAVSCRDCKSIVGTHRIRSPFSPLPVIELGDAMAVGGAAVAEVAETLAEYTLSPVDNARLCLASHSLHAAFARFASEEALEAQCLRAYAECDLCVQRSGMDARLIVDELVHGMIHGNRLSLSDCEDALLRALALALGVKATIVKVKHLRFSSSVECSSDALQLLFHALTSVIEIESLHMCVNLGPRSMICRSLSSCIVHAFPWLSSLKLPGCQLNTSCVEHIARALQCCTGLVQLDLSNNDIDDVSMLAECISHRASEIHKLNLTQNPLGANAYQLSLALPMVEKLKILACSLTDTGVAKLFHETPPYAPFPCSLEMQNNFIGDSALSSLSFWLKHNTGLRHINLSDNYISHSAACEVASTLKAHNSSLTLLELQRNHDSLHDAFTAINKLNASVWVAL